MSEGPPTAHIDNGAPSLIPSDSEYSVNTEYDDHPDKDEYGPVTSRFDDEIVLEHPALDIETLRQSTHLIAQLHHHNRERWDGWPWPNDTQILYDVAILDVMEQALNEEGLSESDFDIPNQRFKAIFLKEARKPAGLKSFYAYLKSTQAVCGELGFLNSGLPSYETLRVEANENLPAELDELEHGRDAFDNAVTRATYAVYRNGIDAPESVKKAYGFGKVSPPLYEKNVRRSDTQTALRNWVEVLIDETLDPLTFSRDEPRTSFKQYIGLFAASALYGCGVQEVANISDYSYPREQIPKGSGLGKYIRNDLPLDLSERFLKGFDVPSITEQFDAVHRSTLDLAKQRGFFDEARSLAIDLYRIEWDGAENDLTINRPLKSENDISSEWTYAVFGIIDTDARFIFGTRWLQNKAVYPDVVTDLGTISNDFVDVEALYADSELISGDLINAFRGIAGTNWIARAPDHEIVKKLKCITPKNHIGYVPNVSWNTYPKPNLVVYPDDNDDPSLVEFAEQELRRAEQIDTEEQHRFSDYEADGDSTASFPDVVANNLSNFDSMEDIGNIKKQAAYLTDRSLSKHSASKLHSKYYQRWAIEQSINQVSNDTMPVITSGSKKLRLYGVNLAVLFENWHTLINRAPSPKLGLRLSVTQSELLRAIEDVAFSDTM